jgi:ectoine hydroxylase-related dioxygenase (phytanoyl-CoA dioxygenase family)
MKVHILAKEAYGGDVGLVDQWISDEKIAFYRENGFVQVDDVLAPEELDELREYAEEAMAAPQEGLSVKTDRPEGTYYKVLNQKVNTWRDHGGMAKYSLHPRFAQIALKLTGAGGIRLFHDHLLWKMPGDSKPTPWHQDTPKWPMNESGALSIWIALDDVDERNGCMMFIPKSHRAGKLKNISLTDPVDLFEYVKGTDIAKEKPVIVPLKAGSCTFHDGLTFHYAFHNQTEKPRRALAIIYMPDGTTYNGNRHVVTDGQGLETGKPIRGPLFPLLAKP